MKAAPKPVSLAHYPGAAGTDEAGRGPLAGPVVAAAVIIPDDFDLIGIADSKLLDRTQREVQEIRIKAICAWAVAVNWTETVDRLNILHASLDAMRQAVLALGAVPVKVLVDGNQMVPGLEMPCETIVKGDGKVACIAAASILAKCERDRIMTEFAAEYPGYGFDRHYGYPTPEHFEALQRLGPCPIHRRSFGPVRDLIQPSLAI
jgi:ribonuclease HII